MQGEEGDKPLFENAAKAREIGDVAENADVGLLYGCHYRNCGDGS